MAPAADIHEYRDLDPATRVLMGPGPSDVPPRVLRAMAAPTIGHLDPEFLTLMSETQQLLRDVFQTQNALTIPVSGTGSAGMEACFVNLVEPGDEVAIVVNGVFGTRMVDCAGRLGAEVIPIEAEWGRAVDPAAVEAALKGRRPKIFAVVHAETSTGVCQPLADILRIAKDSGALVLLDCVTSLGGVEVALDAWGIDAAFSGTQKCLSCPPGLAPLSFNETAVDKLLTRKTKVPSWYLDLTMVRDYWGSQRKYHHTAPINMIYALREALRVVLEEGLEARFARHQAESRGAGGRGRGDGPEYAGASGRATGQPERGRRPGRGGRRGYPEGAPAAVRPRDRGRPGAARRQDVARRPTGSFGHGTQRAALLGGARGGAQSSGGQGGARRPAGGGSGLRAVASGVVDAACALPRLRACRSDALSHRR